MRPEETGGPSLTLSAPGSKSVTHRMFMLGAMSGVPCRVEEPLWGADTRSTLGVLKSLGASFDVTPGGDVQFYPAELAPSDGVLDCGNSGTSLRLLAG